MTFYNPFFPPFPRYSPQNSPKNAQPEEKKSNTGSINSKKQQETCQNSNSELQKNNRKKTLDLGFIHDYLQDTDTLILLGLLFFLYNEDNKNLPLMFCLFLLLMDN